MKAQGSRVHLSAFDTDIALEYYECVKDLINTEGVQRLGFCPQHLEVDRLQHSVSVSYFSFLLCRRFKLNSRAAARGGLLHDLFYYDRTKVALPGPHSAVHPQQALQNASALTNLTPLECDIITNHMWPMFGIPQSAESLIVTLVDKYCAVSEFTLSVWHITARRLHMPRLLGQH